MGFSHSHNPQISLYRAVALSNVYDGEVALRLASLSSLGQVAHELVLGRKLEMLKKYCVICYTLGFGRNPQRSSMSHICEPPHKYDSWAMLECFLFTPKYS